MKYRYISPSYFTCLPADGSQGRQAFHLSLIPFHFKIYNL